MPPEFEHLITTNNPRIRRIARRYAAPGGIDDLHQEILIQLWRSFKNFRGESKIETWVYRVALNTALTHVKVLAKKRAQEIQLSEEPEEVAIPAERCHADLLTRFLNSLNDIDASVLMMHLDGLTANEIAEVLGSSTNAVSIRINRMKEKFGESYVD